MEAKVDSEFQATVLLNGHITQYVGHGRGDILHLLHSAPNVHHIPLHERCVRSTGMGGGVI